MLRRVGLPGRMVRASFRVDFREGCALGLAPGSAASEPTGNGKSMVSPRGGAVPPCASKRRTVTQWRWNFGIRNGGRPRETRETDIPALHHVAGGGKRYVPRFRCGRTENPASCRRRRHRPLLFVNGEFFARQDLGRQLFGLSRRGNIAFPSPTRRIFPIPWRWRSSPALS
jgi:hypothetical protein